MRPAAEPTADSLVRAFGDRTAERPDAVAVSDGGARVRYRELAAAAAAVQRDLRAVGVGPGDRVGISMTRSWRVLAAILGVLATGASYVPLDPDYPVDRLRYMAADSGLRAVCADPGARPDLGADLPLVAVTGETGGAGPALDAGAAAGGGYVIYTSGSTGRPKGVPIPQGHVLELFRGAGAVFSFGPADVWTLYHSYSFDFSVWEMWGALLHGGRLVVVSPAQARDPRAMLDLLDAEGVSVLSQVPSPFKYLVNAYARRPRELPALRYVVFGGEALDKPSVRRWLALRQGPERLVDMYGITETTVHVTAATVTAEDVADDAGPTRIGRPLPHLGVTVVRADGTPAPTGEPGEMYVAGSTLSPGYLGRPDLTAERFPTVDLGAGPLRHYRSGDLARYDADGELHYLGRTDSQVNLRGFRIELGEIEAVLRDTDTVADAAATVVALPSGERTLVALVVAGDGTDNADGGGTVGARLRELCRARLPAHMVPDRITVVEAIPTTPSGKVDRKAVTAAAGRAGRPAAGRAPGGHEGRQVG